MLYFLKKYYLFFLGTLLCVSCTSEMRDKLTPKPTAFGKVNEIVVIADENTWNGAIGDTLRYYLSSAYIILPQPEPIFDLRHFTPQELREAPLRSNFRSYLVLANLSDATSPTTQLITRDLGQEKIRRGKETPDYNLTVGHNKWADQQMLIYQFGNNPDQLMNNIRKNAASIAKRINKHDGYVIDANIYQAGVNQELTKLMTQQFGIAFNVPDNYFLALNDSTEQTIWMRRETDFLSSNIFVHKIPYTDAKQLSKEGLKRELNKLGRYVSTTIEATYKHINDEDLPLYIEKMQLNGHYAIELRGIWEIVNDFMGGPFISYAILNEQANEIILLEGFVHAPGKEKRNYMQQLAYLLSTVKA